MNSKYKEIIREPFDILSSKLVEISFYKNFIENNTKAFIKNNSKQKEERKNLQTNDDFVSSCNYICYNPYNGRAISLGNKTDTIESRVQTIECHYDKQCQWLLVEAYENFERYLKNLYAHIGYIDNTFWSASDFGNISINEIKNQHIEWFQSKKIKNTNDILKQIRKNIPVIGNAENKNKLRKPLRLITIIIEQLRHIIVHNNGKLENKKEFIEKIIKEGGLFKNGKYDTIIYENIDKLFYGDVVRLKKVISKGNYSAGIPIEINYDGFSDLLSNLGSYVIVIQTEVEKYLDKKFTEH